MCKFANKWVKDSLMVWCLFSIAGMLMTYLNFFSSLDHAEKFKLYLFSKYPNKHFSLEKENDGHLSFLDINIFREKENLSQVFIGKTPSSGVYTNLHSFIQTQLPTWLYWKMYKNVFGQSIKAENCCKHIA